LKTMSDIEHIIETALGHQRAGRLDEAADIYQKVLEIDPSYADAIHLLGMVFFAKQDYRQSIDLIGRAILLNANVADYHINIASAYLAIAEAGHAKFHAELAINLSPSSAEAHYNLGNALFAEGAAVQASIAFKQALDLNPRSQTIWANYLFALNFSSEASPRDIFDANRKWGSLLEDGLPKPPSFSTDAVSERRLKLGYFLPELDLHVTTRFLGPVLEAHDKVKFEIIGYGYRTDGGPPPNQIKEAIDLWVDVSSKTPAEIAETMRGDAIDILVHPCTFKSRYREVLAHRAAPIQIACTNLVSTTGLKAVDYLITDKFISPPNSDEGIYTEKLVRLSGFNTYQQIEAAGEVVPLPALANNFITFGSCNNIAKLGSEVIQVWSEILAKVENSKLLLKHRAFDNADRRALITEAFYAADISDDRLILRGFTPDPADYLTVYNEIDIALDPFPFGGGTVSYEALWMGVPVLTLAGDVLMGRLTGSLMHRLGLPEWVTHSSADYIVTAERLAADTAALAALRRCLRAKAQDTIFDAKAHVLELEMVFENAWRDHVV
jgi:protein O-GlcNAc transferase